MWDIGGDEWDLFDVVDTFGVVSLSLDKLELEIVLFKYIGEENIDIQPWFCDLLIVFKCDLFMLLRRY